MLVTKSGVNLYSSHGQKKVFDFLGSSGLNTYLIAFFFFWQNYFLIKVSIRCQSD